MKTKTEIENAKNIGNVANALSSRENFDFREARELLASSPPERRDLEWNLINHLCQGDQHWTCKLPDTPPVNLALHKKEPILLLHDGSLHQVHIDSGTL